MDIFEKCNQRYIQDEVRDLGIYPYFHALESRQDTEVIMEGKRRIMLGSNNYLGLTTNEAVVKAGMHAYETLGSGCSGSRFLNGTLKLHLELEDELMNFSDVSYKSFVKSESEIITLFYDKFADIPLLSRMDAVAETFIDEIETLLNRDLPEEERIPLIEKFRKMYETMDFYVLYNRFLKKEGYQTLPRRPLEKRKLRYEDVYPVLYLKYRLSRQAERSNIKHLVIDEM